MTHPLIGQKVNLKVTVLSRVYENLSPEPITSTTYEVDDPHMENVIRLSFEGKLRIWTPSSRGTANSDLSRTNVHIDKDGIITKINLG